MEALDPKQQELIDKAFADLGSVELPYQRKQTFFSFGKKEVLKPVFIECFRKYDNTIKEFVWLPEYDEVLDWMVDNEGRGLYLTGDCGRGKSTIILGVIKPLFKPCFKKKLHGFHATELVNEIHSDFIKKYRWNYQKYFEWKFSYIDELGVERMVNDFGEKFEAFNEIINIAEQDLNILILSSNLTGDQFLRRYGDRSVDRLKRLCRIVKFKGKSLR